MAGGIVLAATMFSAVAALPAAADPALRLPVAVDVPVPAEQPAPAAQPVPAEQPVPAVAVPATAEEAKQAWLDAARRSESYNEQVLTAQAAVDAAKARSDEAAAQLAAAADRTSAEQQKVSAADAVVAQFQAKVDAFANASFRGARTDDLTVLLTSSSPQDYLDQAGSLSQIATDQQQTLSGALAARQGAAHAPSVQAGIAVEAALSRQGLPYVWGAVGPDTFDCSGLMLWAWQQAGVEIPRNSGAQAGLHEIPLDQLQPGDLVTYYSPVSHVGMYVGDGKVLHASMPGVPIKVVPLAAAGPNPTGHAVNR